MTPPLINSVAAAAAARAAEDIRRKTLDDLAALDAEITALTGRPLPPAPAVPAPGSPEQAAINQAIEHALAATPAPAPRRARPKRIAKARPTKPATAPATPVPKNTHAASAEPPMLDADRVILGVPFAGSEAVCPAERCGGRMTWTCRTSGRGRRRTESRSWECPECGYVADPRVPGPDVVANRRAPLLPSEKVCVAFQEAEIVGSTADKGGTALQPARAIVLSEEQTAAVEKAVAWYRAWKAGAHRSQVHYIAGYAGTGKSTVLPQIIAAIGAPIVKYAAFTGKAARVMQSKGCADASTIHHLIYAPEERWVDGRLVVAFGRQGALSADLIVLDECSMVDEATARDILAHRIPVLVLGDPGQLPPVRGLGFFTNRRPDSLLTQVHRQAQGNPIIAASMRVREDPHARLDDLADGDRLAVCRLAALSDEDLLAAGLVLCGKHTSRRGLNDRLRKAAGHGAQDHPTRTGARIVVTRNNHDLGLYNGVVYEAVGTPEMPSEAALREEWTKARRRWLDEPTGDRVALKMAERYDEILDYGRRDPETFRRFVRGSIREAGTAEPARTVDLFIGEFQIDAQALKAGAKGADFEPRTVAQIKRDEALIKTLGLVRATWGFSITTHKSQGSQWPSVVLVDDGWGLRQDIDLMDRSRWLYTAITRAAERLIIAS